MLKMHAKLIVFILFNLLIAMSHASPTSNNPLIPREILFGNPDKAMVSVSPNGEKIAYLAPRDGVLNVYVSDIADPTNGKPVTNDRHRGVRTYFWCYNPAYMFYLQDEKGDEDWHLYRVNLTTFEAKNLTPFKKVQANINKVSKKFPDKIIIELNKEDPKYFDLYELDIPSGNLKMIYRNENKLSGFLLDENYRIRFASKENDDGSRTVFKMDKKLNLKPFTEISYDDSLTTYLIRLNKAGDTLYMVDSRNRNTAALFSHNLRKGTNALLFHDAKADISDVLFHPVKKTPQSVSVNYLRAEEHVLDEAIKDDIKFLSSYKKDAEMHVVSRDMKDHWWVIGYMFDDQPVYYYLYNRQLKAMQFLFSNRKNLEQFQLSKVRPIVIKSRDGLNLVSYLVLPKFVEPKNVKEFASKQPVPLVLTVHGGPQARDTWGLDNEAQWLANRGYAVLSVNYRGSVGFGKNFVNAGNREWAGKMHDDLIDAVQWAIKNKITTKDKVCIYGGSYGGYATLVGLTFTPNIFACGVDIVGPSNLTTLLKSIPPYWASFYKNLLKRIGGDPDTDEGRQFLLSRSPITFAQNIKKPLLIAQGVHDPRVKQAESDQVVAAMKQHNIPVTYLLYSDEGHGFARPENRMSFYAVAEQFLAQNLGGQVEPIGNAFSGASIRVVEGKIKQ